MNWKRKKKLHTCQRGVKMGRTFFPTDYKFETCLQADTAHTVERCYYLPNQPQTLSKQKCTLQSNSEIGMTQTPSSQVNMPFSVIVNLETWSHSRLWCWTRGQIDANSFLHNFWYKVTLGSQWKTQNWIKIGEVSYIKMFLSNFVILHASSGFKNNEPFKDLNNNKE